MLLTATLNYGELLSSLERAQWGSTYNHYSLDAVTFFLINKPQQFSAAINVNGLVYSPERLSQSEFHTKEMIHIPHLHSPCKGVALSPQSCWGEMGL